jgi:threonine dehydrogenase-like Zn-dependent dehydrogenase
MKALRFERKLARYAAAKVAGSLAAGAGARVGPLSLVEISEPDLPAEGWARIEPILSGICGSDLATIDGKSSRYFEPIVSFPFVPGHEVVGRTSDGTRVVLEPVLACAARGIDPPCAQCAAGNTGRCERLTAGHVDAGLQTGFCTDTGGGWSHALVAHESQLHAVPDALTDDDAVMVEPAACAIHAVLRARVDEGDTVVVIGAGTLGLLAVAALRAFTTAGHVVVAAKHPEQRAIAARFGASIVVEPDEIGRAVRRVARAHEWGRQLTAGADVVLDCVGSAASIQQSLSIAGPGGRVVLVGMPAPERIDLTPLWHREVELVGAYAYGTERVGSRTAHTFDLAFELAGDAELGQLVSARYPLERWRDAIEHAANAGRRGAVKVVFDLTTGARR